MEDVSGAQMSRQIWLYERNVCYMSHHENIYHHFPGLKMESLDLFKFQAFQLINLWLQKSFLLNESPKIILAEDTELGKQKNSQEDCYPAMRIKSSQSFRGKLMSSPSISYRCGLGKRKTP